MTNLLSSIRHLFQSLTSEGSMPALHGKKVLVFCCTFYWYGFWLQAQIQQKINKGQILPAAIPIELKRRRDVCKSLDSGKPPHPEKKQLGNPHRFYSDMDDLRRKIQAGEIPRSKGASVTPTLMERLFPPFLSPRVSNMNRPGTTTIYYDPPLLPLDCQNPQSNFFAGENPKCKLPTPLPENPAYINAIQSGRASAHPTSGSQPGSSRLSRQNSMVLMRQPSRVSREPSFIINRETSYIKSRQPTMSWIRCPEQTIITIILISWITPKQCDLSTCWFYSSMPVMWQSIVIFIYYYLVWQINWNFKL